MSSAYAILLILLPFAVGEILALKTKAILSTTLVAAIAMLIYFWCGVPTTIISDSSLYNFGMVMAGIFLAGLATTIDFKELVRQWKTIVISFLSVLVAVAAIILLGSAVIGRDYAFAGAPIFAGSMAATLIMSGVLSAAGKAALGVFCVVVMVMQHFVGIPFASFLLRKEAKNFLKDPQNIAQYASEATAAQTEQKKLVRLPKIFSIPAVVLVKLAAAAALANFLTGLCHGKIHFFVMTLIVSIVLTELGFLDKNSLPKTESSKIIIIAVTVTVFQNFSAVTPGDVVSMLWPMLFVLLVGTVVTSAVAVVLGKLVKISPYLSIAMGVTCMFGFPTTMYIPDEVAKTHGRTPEEVQAISNYLMPKIVTAGIITVSISSVFIANWVANMY